MKDIEASEKRMDLVKLTDQIYIAEDHFYYRENSVVYIGEKDVTVISATWSPETAKLLTDKIRSITNKPIKAVVNTHFHLDRSGGNPHFKKIGAKIIASKMTVDLMRKNWDARVKEVQKDYPGFPSIDFINPDMTFDDKFMLEGGKIQILYFGPAHTEDGVVAYFPDEQVLFGDCIVKEKLGWLGDANLAEYPKTLERIKKLKIKTIIAGHWTSLHGPALIDQLLNQLKELSPSEVYFYFDDGGEHGYFKQCQKADKKRWTEIKDKLTGGDKKQFLGKFSEEGELTSTSEYYYSSQQTCNQALKKASQWLNKKK